mmetsp:Transcript_22578/g.19582  ORF Transcript_22578/g.19582 Transcript_22578/m.19582 type:complete len:122 (+) Transcript_22578:212-577(+)
MVSFTLTLIMGNKTIRSNISNSTDSNSNNNGSKVKANGTLSSNSNGRTIINSKTHNSITRKIRTTANLCHRIKEDMDINHSKWNKQNSNTSTTNNNGNRATFIPKISNTKTTSNSLVIAET